MKEPLVALLGFLLLATPAAQAQFNYTTNNGSITITGYTGPGGAVSIPASINDLPVTSIGDSAFSYRTNLTSITMPGSVTNFGDYAFQDCFSLTSITIPNSVVSIGSGAFQDCSSLTSITIPNSVVTIGFQAFYACSSLAILTIGSGVINIGDEALVFCSGLTNVTIPNTITSIGEGVFAGTGLISVTIPDSVTSIGDEAFEDCSRLAAITVGNGVTNIGYEALGNCTSLTAITVAPLNPLYSGLDGVLFDKSQSTIIQYPFGKVGSYIIPDGVTSIGDKAFIVCANLTSVTIADSVLSIGYFAFEGCINLTNVTIGTGVTNIGYWGFANCANLATVYFKGNAPSDSPDDFIVDTAGGWIPEPATVYYLPGTCGWSNTFSRLPTALWLPKVQTGDGSFGVRTNRFGFNIAWASGQTVVVEACTDLANSLWSPVSSNTLTSGSVYFSDTQWTNYPDRFYRIRSL